MKKYVFILVFIRTYEKYDFIEYKNMNKTNTTYVNSNTNTNPTCKKSNTIIFARHSDNGNIRLTNFKTVKPLMRKSKTSEGFYSLKEEPHF